MHASRGEPGASPIEPQPCALASCGGFCASKARAGWAASGCALRKAQPLLDWGQGLTRSKDQNAAIAMPVAALVNRRTSGSAEALAAVLQKTGTALVLGDRTAGSAITLE